MKEKKVIHISSIKDDKGFFHDIFHLKGGGYKYGNKEFKSTKDIKEHLITFTKID